MRWFLPLIFLLAAPPAMAASNLLNLYQEALNNDPTLLQASAQHQAAEARKEEAKGQLLPQITSNHSFSQSQQKNTLSQISYSGQSHALSLQQALYDPANWRSYQRYKELAEGQSWSSQEKTNLGIIQLAELYFRVLAAEDELRLTQAELDAMLRNQKRMQALYQRQMTTLPELLKTEARTASLQAALLDAQHAVLDSRERLAERVGRPLTEPLWPLRADAALSLPELGKIDWETLTLQKNPTLLSHSATVEAANHAYQAAIAQHLPRVNLSLTAQRSDIGYEGSMAPQNTTLIAAIGVRIPLFSGGTTHARATALQAEKTALIHEHERIKREVLREVKASRQRLISAPERIKAAQQAQTAAEKSYAATEKAFELGVVTSVDLLESLRDNFKAQRELLLEKYNYINNLLILYRWSGHLNADDILQSNALLQPPS